MLVYLFSSVYGFHFYALVVLLETIFFAAKREATTLTVVTNGGRTNTRQEYSTH
jgi:hypothetical protein